MLEYFFKNQFRCNANSIAYHDEAFSILWYPIILCFQNSVIVLVLTTKIFLKIMFDFFYFVYHSFYILHNKKLRTNVF